MPNTPSVVLRDRLVTSIDQRWNGGLGIVLGGPGLGKSTLLRQAMFESATLDRGVEIVIRCRSAWTSSSVHAAICRQLDLADDVGQNPQVETVNEYLWSLAPQRSGVVFDDVHLLAESGITYVLELREALASNAHLLVASRENPLLTAMLMTADPSFVIDGGDLLFTAEEIDAYASETGADRDSLLSAGGWPAVLALTASAGSDVAGAYLYQKVLAGLSRRQQGDLAVAAALGDLDDDLARAVLEGRASDLASIPLVELPRAGGIIVHDLWTEPLEGLADPDRLQAARLAAAAQAEAAGDIDRAVSVLTAGGLIAEARAAILRHIATGADRVPLERIDRWLRLVTAPDQALLRQMLQLLRSGLVAGSLNDREIEAITAQCRNAGELDLEALACEIRFATAWSADNAPECIAIADRLAELHEQGVASAAHGRFLSAITAARSEGNNTHVLQLIQQARELLGSVGGPDWNTSLELETLVALGRPFDALKVLRETEKTLAEHKVRSVTYGLTYWFAGRADEALHSLDLILREPGRFDGLERSWRATSTLFRLYRGIEATAPLPDFSDQDERFSTYSRVCEGLTDAARAVHDGDEERASALVDDLAVRLPPTDGFTIQAWFMGGALWYMLRPDDRPMLDAFMTDAIYRQARALFQSVALGREHGTIDSELVAEWPQPAQVGTLLPARWAAEVALRLPDEFADLRREVLESLEGAGHPALTLLAASTDPGVAALAAAALGERPAVPSEAITIRLFGTPRLDVTGRPEAAEWRRGRVRALLGFLADRRRTTREAAIDALWPDLDPDAGRRNLRVTLSYLGRILEPDRAKSTPPWFVRADGETLELHTDGLDIDVIEVNDHLMAARSHQRNGLASKSIDALRATVEAYSGDFLEGVDDEWILEAREQYRQRTLDACLRLVALLQAGRSDEAVGWARRAIELDPLSIDAREALVDALESGPSHEREAAQRSLRELLDELA